MSSASPPDSHPAVEPTPSVPPKPASENRGKSIQVSLLAGGLLVLTCGGLLFWRARSDINQVALADAPKGVTVETALQTTYRPTSRYVGTLDPWVEAKVGPQYVSAYISTVLVRPGAVVKKGQILAILDCRNAAALSKSVSSQTQAMKTLQAAIRDRAHRLSQMVDGGFVSADEVEQRTAESTSKESEVLALQAQVIDSTLKVDDCVLRAPFDGEVATRFQDPGGFAKPDQPIVSLVDRDIIRLAIDVPESDFAFVAPGSMVRIRTLSTGETLEFPVSRRAPAADPTTRTVHVEIDMPDPQRRVPVYTTAEVEVAVGNPMPVTEVPFIAASMRGDKATLFVVQDGKARRLTVPVLGETSGKLYLDPSLAAGSKVVVEGRSLLSEGDLVTAREAPAHRVSTASNDSGTPQSQVTP